MRIKISLIFVALLCSFTLTAQRNRKPKTQQPTPTLSYPDSLYNAMEWRNIGPFRGGRSTASTGVVGEPFTYYFGSVGGGVWKTTDAGLHWKNISDKFFNATSIGAIAVAESDPNVIYVGTGEACVRGVMTSHGDGVYKSTDAGLTWKNIGLEKTLHISRIRIHPQNPDIVYVAAQGSAYAPTPDRGVYKSVNGGETWERIHFVDQSSGVNDLTMDMTNPRILYAAFWDTRRTPWFIRSGGAGSGIWKTMDSGKTWTKLKKGLPEDLMGKIGVTVSRANPDRLFAIIESDKGGLYRSDDKGESWMLMNSERILRTRSWYYMHVFAHPTNEDVVYVLNAPFNKSIDGGKTFVQVPVPHGDNHDLWINPAQPGIMINSNDGGANISFNGGKSWSTQKNQPTAQFYRVNADNRYPYWLYAGQQDNSTLAIPSMAGGAGIGWQDWIANVGGGEAAHIAFDKDNPKYIYSSNITGFIDEYNLATRKQRAIKPYPVFDLGEPSDGMKYRYNWNPPVLVSQHDPSVIYYGSQLVHKSVNRAQKWDDISPDLTRNDTTHLGLMGGPITNEAAGGETYHTLMTLAESPHNAKVLWAGADDGLLHLTQDGGSSWQNVTPGPEGIINSIEVSPHAANTVYITLMRYKFNDFKPYVYASSSNGQSWRLITNGIPEGAYARVVREDPDRKGLLYAGTERGLYISFDAGNSWKKFQQNLPMVPITDLVVHHQDLVAATHGRAFWILDDLTPLHQLSTEVANSNLFLYQPKDAVNTYGFEAPPVPELGTNPYPGAVIKFYVRDFEAKDSVEFKIDILKDDRVIRTFSNLAEEKSKQLAVRKGMNLLKWDLMVEPIKTSKGVMPAAMTGEYPGYHVSPGIYGIRLSVKDFQQSQLLTVLQDPRDEASPELMKEKYQVLDGLYQHIKQLYQTLDDMQEVRTQIKTMTDRMANDNEIQETGDLINQNIDKVESDLISPQQETFQDIINYRNKLDLQLHNLMQTIDNNTPPLTEGEKLLLQELNKEWAKVQQAAEKILIEDVGGFNQLLRDKGVEYIAPKNDGKEKDSSI
jgi:photosystem II stability/assembly factor-like uncharacterized protein